MKKKNVNEYTLLNADKSVFENIYSIEDPWKLSGKQEQFRYKLVMDYIKNIFQKPGLKVLELGCGEGSFTEYLDLEDYKITSVDISETAIERAKKKGLRNAKFVCNDMIEFVTGNDISCYDLILLMECIYYLSKEKKIVLIDLLRKKTNQDIRILISFPVNNKNEIFFSEKRVIKKFSDFGFGQYKNFNGVILSSKGITGKLLEYIPSDVMKKFYFFLHKILFSFRINQKLFMFRKD
jgi:SAM-dependent methyltransferase